MEIEDIQVQEAFIHPSEEFRNQHKPKQQRTEDDRAKSCALSMGQWMEICNYAFPSTQQANRFGKRPNVATILHHTHTLEPTEVFITSDLCPKQTGGIRDKMAHDSAALKMLWIINTKLTYRDDCEAMRAQLAERDRSDYKEMIKWKDEQALEIITRAKDLNLHQRDEIREIDGSRYEVAVLRGKDRQLAFHKMIKEKQDQQDTAFQKKVLK